MMTSVTTPPALAPDPATAAARVIVQALAALGVEDVVLAPGSRSAPLAYALADAARPDGQRPAGAPALRLHVRVDERSAAFLALGLAKASGDPRPPRRGRHHLGHGRGQPAPGRPRGPPQRPAAAAAHRRPAARAARDRREPDHGPGRASSAARCGWRSTCPRPSALPDEARSLRRLVSRAVAAATGARTGDPGPVHLDLAFREPLVPGDAPWPEPSTAGLTHVQARPATGAVPVVGEPGAAPARRGGAPTVLVAGDGAGPAARRLAEANGWPLLAEPSSGARGGSHAIAAYRLLLAHPSLGGAVRRAVVLGRPTLSRPVQRLLAREDVEVVVVAPRGADWPDAARNAGDVLLEAPARMRQGRMPAPGGLARRLADGGRGGRCGDRRRARRARRGTPVAQRDPRDGAGAGPRGRPGQRRRRRARRRLVEPRARPRPGGPLGLRAAWSWPTAGSRASTARSPPRSASRSGSRTGGCARCWGT